MLISLFMNKLTQISFLSTSLFFLFTPLSFISTPQVHSTTPVSRFRLQERSQIHPYPSYLLWTCCGPRLPLPNAPKKPCRCILAHLLTNSDWMLMGAGEAISDCRACEDTRYRETRGGLYLICAFFHFFTSKSLIWGDDAPSCACVEPAPFFLIWRSNDGLNRQQHQNHQSLNGSINFYL